MTQVACRFFPLFPIDKCRFWRKFRETKDLVGCKQFRIWQEPKVATCYSRQQLAAHARAKSRQWFLVLCGYELSLAHSSNSSILILCFWNMSRNWAICQVSLSTFILGGKKSHHESRLWSHKPRGAHWQGLKSFSFDCVWLRRGDESSPSEWMNEWMMDSTIVIQCIERRGGDWLKSALPRSPPRAKDQQQKLLQHFKERERERGELDISPLFPPLWDDQCNCFMPRTLAQVFGWLRLRNSSLPDSGLPEPGKRIKRSKLLLSTLLLLNKSSHATSKFFLVKSVGFSLCRRHYESLNLCAFA